MDNRRRREQQQWQQQLGSVAAPDVQLAPGPLGVGVVDGKVERREDPLLDVRGQWAQSAVVVRVGQHRRQYGTNQRLRVIWKVCFVRGYERDNMERRLE